MQLNRVLTREDGKEVYSVNTRSIYRLDDPEFGAIAVKELRLESYARQIRNRLIRQHRFLCEFKAASAFAARGGITPPMLGAAMECSSVRIFRLFIVMAWIENASSLSDAVRDWDETDLDYKLAELATFLVAAARLGLVHGRHSSENIMLSPPLNFHVIDFSHAQLFQNFNAPGFVRDVARIGARLIIESACDENFIKRFFEVVVACCDQRAVTTNSLWREFSNVRTHSKRRQRIAREWYTRWRGFPFRLG